MKPPDAILDGEELKSLRERTRATAITVTMLFWEEETGAWVLKQESCGDSAGIALIKDAIKTGLMVALGDRYGIVNDNECQIDLGKTES